MTLPYQQTTIQDPGLNKVSPVTNIPMVLGCSSSGTAATVTTLNTASAARSTFGEGPLVEALCSYLAIVGGPVRAVKLAQDSDGSMSATLSKSGSGPDITDNSSTPYDWYSVKVKITTAGAIGTSKFKYSLDGGRSYSQAITTAATYNIPSSGVSLAFAVGSYVVDEVYSGTATGPTYTAVEMDSAFTAIEASPLSWDFGCLAGRHADASTASTIHAALETDRAGLSEPAKYRPWVMDAGGDNVATTLSGFTATSKQIARCYGTVAQISQKPNSGYTTPALPLYIGALVKAGKELISTDWSRVLSGPMIGVASWSTEFGSPLSHDEFITGGGLDEAGFVTARSWKGLSGYYLTRGRMSVADGSSDFGDWQFARMFSEAHEIIHQQQTQMIGRSWAVKSDGTLLEGEAAAAEAKVESALRAIFHQKNAEGTRGHVSLNPDAATIAEQQGFFYTLDRTQDVAATNQIVFSWGLKPRGYSYFITGTGGFVAQAAS